MCAACPCSHCFTNPGPGEAKRVARPARSSARDFAAQQLPDTAAWQLPENGPGTETQAQLR